MNNAREDRQDFVDDQWDDHRYYGYGSGYGYTGAFVAGAAVGASAAYVATLPCSTTVVIVNGTSYYQCGTTWYSRGNQGGSVVYIVTSAPAGH